MALTQKQADNLARLVLAYVDAERYLTLEEASEFADGDYTALKMDRDKAAEAFFEEIQRLTEGMDNGTNPT